MLARDDEYVHIMLCIFYIVSSYANSVWTTKNNVKANIWKLYMKFEANKEFMENLSLQT